MSESVADGPATIGINGSALGSSLANLLLCDAIVPGSTPSYQVCKEIYVSHPLGHKMSHTPVKMAMSQAREIEVADAPEEVVKAFLKTWKDLRIDRTIANLAGTARIYGVASTIYGAADMPTEVPMTAEQIQSKSLYFNVLDPLNTSGSLVLNQDPTAPDFQKVVNVSAGGKAYHPSRACVLMNEDPIYIEFSTSAFGYVGRSVYQRALFPLKSFIQSMLTDDMVTQKAGVLIAKIKPAGSITDRIMAAATGFKRSLLRGARTYNVLSIHPDESIESLNLQNIDGAVKMSRENILKNIATAADMPARMLDNETLVEGFGEGTEDAKLIARYLDGIRQWLDPVYEFFDQIVMQRAWTPEFFAAMQAANDDLYAGMDYQTAFIAWKNAFETKWPSLLSEPESEKAKTSDIKLKAVIAVLEVLLPQLDPENKAVLILWAQDALNGDDVLFKSTLALDADALRTYTPPTQQLEPGAGKEEAPPAPFKAAA